MAASLFALLIFCLLDAVHGYSSTSGLPRHLKRADQIKDEYDFVIAGGGTAGLTVGDRLSESGKYSVLVIEYGDSAPPSSSRSQEHFFNFSSVAQPGLNNRSFPVVVGKAVGGSSAVNGMQAFRGTKIEYDLWAKLGSNGSTWDWNGMLPYFRRGTHFVPPLDYLASDFNITWDLDVWGQDNDTRVYTGYPNYLPPRLKVLYQGMATMPGIELPKDGNAGTDGLFFYPSTINPRTYTRSSARTGHWDGIERSNYELIENSAVTKIEFDGDRAIGFTFISTLANSSSEPKFVKARREAILAAGAIHTPQILQLSGIGPASVLAAANIPQKVDLPGVGENFQDHGWFTHINFNWTTPPPDPPVNTSGDPKTALTLNCGAITGLPVFAAERVDELARSFAAQDPAAYLPADVHPHVLAGYKAQKEAFSTIIRDKNTAWMWLILRSDPNFGPANQHPLSRGSVHIDPHNPSGQPIVDYRAFSNPLDIAASIEMLRFVRKYMALEFFAPYGPVEVSPGAKVATDAQIGEWMRENYTPSVYHPVGTAAKMPRELGGVVDEGLRVYGVEGLSVVDASVMPMIPGAPTSVTVYAVAEKAADLIMMRIR